MTKVAELQDIFANSGTFEGGEGIAAKPAPCKFSKGEPLFLTSEGGQKHDPAPPGQSIFSRPEPGKNEAQGRSPWAKTEKEGVSFAVPWWRSRAVFGPVTSLQERTKCTRFRAEPAAPAG